MANIGTVEGILRLKGRRKSEKELEKFAQKVKDVGRKISAVGKGLTVGLTAPILGVGAAALKMAVDAVESENLFSESFGDMADAARQWSEETGEALRLSRLELRRQSATIFTMVESMGLGRDAAFDLATGVTELAGDMASFYNLPHEEAFDKLRSGLTGEAEPLKRLGILVDENTIKNAAYRNGIAALGSELTNSQKVQARWVAILEQTSKAQGDLARTLDSPANKLRALKTRIVEAATNLGIALLPMFNRALDVAEALSKRLETLVHGFTNLPPPMQNTALAVTAFAAALGPALILVGKATIAMSGLIAAATKLGITAAGTLSVITGPVGWIAAAAALVLAWKPARELLFDLAKTVFSALKTAASSVIETFSRWWSETTRGRAFIVELAKVISRDLISAVKTVWGWIKDLAFIIGLLVKGLGKAIVKLGQWALSFKPVQVALNIVIGLVKVVIGAVTTVVGAIAGAAAKLWEWAGGWSGVEKALNAVLPGFSRMVDLVQKWTKEAKENIPTLEVSTETYENAREGLENLGDEVDTNTEWQKKLGEALESSTEQMEEGKGAAKKLATSYGDLLDETEDLLKQNDLMRDFGISSEEAARAVAIISQRKAEDERITDQYIKSLIEQIEVHSRLADQLERQEELLKKIQKLEVGRNAALARNAMLGGQSMDQFLDGMLPSWDSFGMFEGFDEAMASLTADFLKDATEEMEKQDKAAKAQLETWSKIAESVSNAFGPALKEIDEDLGNLVAGVVQLVDMFKQLGQSASDLENALAGAAFGSAVGGLMGGMMQGSVFEGDRGQSRFGGQRSGDYGDVGSSIGGAIGGAIGSTIGPVGTVVGSVIGSVLGGIVGGAIKKGADEGLATIQQIGDTAAFRIEKAEGGLRGPIEKIADSVLDTVNEIVDLLGGELDSIAKVSFKIRDDTISVFIGNIKREFTDMADAIHFAAVQTLARSSISNIGPAVQAALDAARKGILIGIDEFKRALEIATELDMSGMTDVAKEMTLVFRNIQNKLQEFIDAAVDWQLPLAQIANIGRVFASDWQSLRNDITGVVRSEREIFEERRRIFNANLEAEKQRIKAEIASVEATIASLEARMSAQMTFDQAMVGMATNMLGIGIDFAQAAGATDRMLADARRELAALNAALEGLEGIDPIRPGDFRGRGGGGPSQAEQDLERLNTMLRDAAEQGMSAFQRELARINRRWDEAIPLARGNADLLARIAAARQAEIEAIRQQAREEFTGDAQDFIGQAGPQSSVADSVAQVRDATAALREEYERLLEEGILRTTEATIRWGEVLAAQEDQLNRISQEGVANLAGALAEIVQDEELNTRLRAEMEKINFILRMEQLRAEFEALKALGKLTEAQLNLLQEAFDWVDANFGDIMAGFEMPRMPVRQVRTATREVSAAVEDMARRLASAQDNIRGFLLDLQTGQFGGRSNEQSFNAALAQFQQLMSQPRNIQAQEGFTDTARRLVELARERFASGERFQDILRMVEESGLDLLEIDQVQEDNVVFDDRFLSAQMRQIQTQQNVQDTNHKGFNAISTDLQTLNQTQKAMLERITALEQETRKQRQQEQRKSA